MHVTYFDGFHGHSILVEIKPRRTKWDDTDTEHYFFLSLCQIYHLRHTPLHFFGLVGIEWKAAFGLDSADPLLTNINQIVSCMNNGDGKSEGREQHVSWNGNSCEYPR